ncbi:hypothetical protein FDA94_38080 [Herbidospora galbida]|uniref:Peptidase MA-like domain-containing protein n=1 Tax=Herbidospora galbida TaxID=2575442 RepID=A0A4U3LNN3_9ACTN|nr:hypothetical protein [Herbidospora galbida]TKK77270.1 hypothetical protein FDA94_38080 [Herbidospora galbida]
MRFLVTVSVLLALLSAGQPPKVLYGQSWPFAVHGEHVQVLAADRRFPDLAAEADRAAEAVARVWGSPVTATVLAPATTARAAEIARPAPVTGMAALAGPGFVVIEPHGWASLSAQGRVIVLAHELTHVATGAATRPDMPVWLVEGYADYVGYRDSGLATGVVAAELAADRRAPRELPTREDFRAGGARVPQAYQEAWLACRYIAERYGEAALTALYRAAQADPATALRRTLGVGEAELTAAWRDYVIRSVPEAEWNVRG